GVLDGAHGGVAAGAGALHLDLDTAQPVLHGGTCGLLGRHLGGERCALAGALEAHGARTRPRDDIPLRVGDRHDGVVERALDVHDTHGDVLALALAGAAAALLRLCHLLLPHGLLLVGDGALGALAGAGVGVGALTA